MCRGCVFDALAPACDSSIGSVQPSTLCRLIASVALFFKRTGQMSAVNCQHVKKVFEKNICVFSLLFVLDVLLFFIPLLKIRTITISECQFLIIMTKKMIL